MAGWTPCAPTPTNWWAWRDCPARAVAVSNEVGSGVVPDTASGRLFRDLLGVLNARIAAESDNVVLMVAGIAMPLRSVDQRHA
jgi:adenosylcobinamide kinase/adenosylcobinamide-phosphate guanylyltransferase